MSDLVFNIFISLFGLFFAIQFKKMEKEILKPIGL